jgi:hypothetical protein
VILRREELGTPISAVVAAMTIANGVRHIYQVVRFKVSVSAVLHEQQQQQQQFSKVDFPRRSVNTLWGAFFLVVLVALNTVSSAILFGVRVFWPVTTFSTLAAVTLVAISVAVGMWLVNQYSDAEMKK